MSRKTWIQYWLIDWAKWMEREGLAYSSETTLSRAMAGQLKNDTFAARLPPGVDAPAGWMQRLVKAMGDTMDNPRKRKYIIAVRRAYLVGMKKARNELKLPERTLRRHMRQGESILMRELKSSG